MNERLPLRGQAHTGVQSTPAVGRSSLGLTPPRPHILEKSGDEDF